MKIVLATLAMFFVISVTTPYFVAPAVAQTSSAPKKNTAAKKKPCPAGARRACY
jgi:hypothetical protein